MTAKLTLRLPVELLDGARVEAERLGISLNALSALALRSYVGYVRRRDLSVDRLARRARSMPVAERSTKVGRNELCPCGTGLKYKRCCGTPGR